MVGKRQLYRQSFNALIGLSSSQVLGPNPRRFAVIFSNPPAAISDQFNLSNVTHNASTATTGVKQTLTVPGGTIGVLTFASVFATAGATQALTLELVRAGVTYSITNIIKAGTISPNLQLFPGDVVQWDCTTALAASTTDLTLSGTFTVQTTAIWLGFQGDAVQNTGILLNPGNNPFVLLGEHIGDAIREPITAIAGAANTPISGIEISEIDCPCDPATALLM